MIENTYFQVNYTFCWNLCPSHMGLWAISRITHVLFTISNLGTLVNDHFAKWIIKKLWAFKGYILVEKWKCICLILLIEKLPYFKLENTEIALGWKTITSYLIWQTLHTTFFSKFRKPLKFCDYVGKLRKFEIWNKLK